MPQAPLDLAEALIRLGRIKHDGADLDVVLANIAQVAMGQRRCSAEEAFAILARVSQDSNRKLREVAESLVDRAVNGPRD